MSTLETRRTPPPWTLALGVGVLVVGLLVWAKWAPYWVKVPSVAESGSLGRSVLAGSPPGFSLRGGLEFAGTYFLAIWPALVAGLLIAAAVATVLPADWLARLFGRSGAGGALRGGALAVPSMMCTCCAAPIAVGLRQRSASVVSSLTYWLANPALNPVVLAFCAFVLPWPWTVLRVAAGLVVVVGAVLLARRSSVPPEAEALDTPVAAPDDRPLAVRFLTTLGRLAVRLLPEYLLLVVALGALRGVLFPVSSSLVSGSTLLVVVGVVVLAVAGTLLPIPTGAEVAVIAALLATGVAPPLAAALLITLPALSLPSLLMVRRAFPRRLLVSVTGLVAGVGVVCAAVATAL